DVRPVLHGPGSYDFVLRGTSSNRARYRSRESGQSPPTLLLAVRVSTPPELRLLAPEAGTRVTPGAPISLEAAAHDAEDGDLGDAIRWRSDRDGALGSGARLVVTTLGHGRHTLEATVADGAGLSATLAVHVLVDSPPVLAIEAPADGASVPGG